MSKKPKKAGKTKKPPTYGIVTLTIHAGASPEPITGARNTPIYQTTSYVFEDVEHAADLFNLQTFGFIYSRLTNPTVSVLEERMAALEGGRAAVCAASGHAAQFLAFFTLLEPGDEFISSLNLYGGSITQFGHSFKRLGWTCHFVDPKDPENFQKALTPKCKAIFIEILANPGGIVLDVEPIADEYAVRSFYIEHIERAQVRLRPWFGPHHVRRKHEGVEQLFGKVELVEKGHARIDRVVTIRDQADFYRHGA